MPAGRSDAICARETGEIISSVSFLLTDASRADEASVFCMAGLFLHILKFNKRVPFLFIFKSFTEDFHLSFISCRIADLHPATSSFNLKIRVAVHLSRAAQMVI